CPAAEGVERPLQALAREPAVVNRDRPERGDQPRKSLVLVQRLPGQPGDVPRDRQPDEHRVEEGLVIGKDQNRASPRHVRAAGGPQAEQGGHRVEAGHLADIVDAVVYPGRHFRTSASSRSITCSGFNPSVCTTMASGGIKRGPAFRVRSRWSRTSRSATTWSND